MGLSDASWFAATVAILLGIYIGERILDIDFSVFLALLGQNCMYKCIEVIGCINKRINYIHRNRDNGLYIPF